MTELGQSFFQKSVKTLQWGKHHESLLTFSLGRAFLFLTQSFCHDSSNDSIQQIKEGEMLRIDRLNSLDILIFLELKISPSVLWHFILQLPKSLKIPKKQEVKKTTRKMKLRQENKEEKP